uniref:E3 ubiquitin-protein ligase n=1 Tax=Peronospora matthiolae TaxID=2874970 RepID=A0AAV1VPC7_9STRA
MDQQATLSTAQDARPSHELHTDAADSRGSRTDVRALLDEMQQRASWGEKEHEAEERRLLQELQTCVVDATSRDALEKLPKRMCAYEFKPGDIAWNCRVCQVDETCVMCNDCFISSDHENHEVFFYYTHSGGCCDCGDTEAWAPEGFCTRHRGAQDVDPLRFLPSDLLLKSRECIDEVMRLVLGAIKEARFGSIIDVDDLKTVRDELEKDPPERRYSVIVHYNELQTSQEFATALNKAHPAIAYQMLKIVSETSSQRQSTVRSKASREDVLELAASLHKYRIVTSIVSCEYKARTPLINSLIQWLASLANLSDGFCRLICEKMCAVESLKHDESSMEVDDESDFSMLRAVIMADSFLPKAGSDALHSLLMALLADPLFKQAFAISFTSSYRQLYREFVAGVGSSTATILAFSVQFFNRATFVKKLVAEYDLLEVLTSSVLETLRKKEKTDFVDVAFDGTWANLVHLLHPDHNRELDIWDVFAMGVQRSQGPTLRDVNVSELALEAERAGYRVRRRREVSPFLSLPPDTEFTGRFELDVTSPVFVCRRYMSGLLDLRYVLQIEGISESFVLKKGGLRLARFLLYLAYIQGACSETRRFGDHVEMESRGWVVTVEFVSTTSDVSSWVVSNAFKTAGGPDVARSPETSRLLITKLAKPLLEAIYFWLASAGKYFPPPDYQVGDTLRADQLETAVSCHFPLQRTLSQLVRVLSDSADGLDVFLSMLKSSVLQDDESVWIHDVTSPIGFWHRVHLIEPVLQAIVWDAQVHSGLWVRNGMAVINHSMNYGEPPFCARFRDLDLLLLQFSFQLLGVDWVMTSITERFGVREWYEAAQSSDAKEAELMMTECLALLSQLASELPPKVAGGDAVRSLVPYLRREIVQRLCVGPCAHSDLSKIANEFFLTRESLFPVNFSGGPILDQILKEVCVEAGFSASSGTGDSSAPNGGKFLYRLKPELLAEYSPTFVHLTRKQHESAHENWFQHRLRSSKKREQEQVDGSPNDTHSTWLDYPMVNMFLPCPLGFRLSRVSILHDDARRLVYESLWRATTDAHACLSVLSRTVHLFTLQLYVVEDVQYFRTMVSASDAERFELERASRIANDFIEWIPREQSRSCAGSGPRCAILHLLLKLNPWSSHGGSASMTKLDGDQKHEIGRGIDWLLHRLSRISPDCRSVVERHQVTEQESRDEAARKLALAQRRKEAQMRAIQQMQRRQAAFAEQMKVMANEAEHAATGDDESGTDGEREKHTPSASDGAGDDSDIEMNASEDDMNDDATVVECAMCHSVNSENSFMCYVGFAQCSPAFSPLNGSSHGHFLSTPMDEMHVGEDIPVHVRLCGHSVHHKCWESYHTSQFQRAITGGHHRHALNAVDVTKKEFLCPLCKSISNVLIPTTTEQEIKHLPTVRRMAPSDGAEGVSPVAVSQLEMVRWLKRAIERRDEKRELPTERHTLSSSDADELTTGDSKNVNVEREGQTCELACILSGREDLDETQPLKKWLEDGLSSVCMAIHKVACGAMQKSQPERYTTSGCNALFHTLLCSFLHTNDSDQLRESLFLEAMRFLPLMLKYINTRYVTNSLVAPTDMRTKILHLLYYGGSDILPDGTVVLESEHPTTQTQTRKQSQWGKVRWPQKPLLLNHLGSVLMKGLLFATSEEDAIYIARLVVLARLVQTLLWYAFTRKEHFTNFMADDLAFSEENVALFTACFSEESANSGGAKEDVRVNGECALGYDLELLVDALVSKCDGAFEVERIADRRQLLNVVACEVVPLAKVATFMIKSLTTRATSRYRHGTTSTSKPIFISKEDVLAVGFVKLNSLQFTGTSETQEQAALAQLVNGWVHRFKAAYEEMNDPHDVLQQWLTTANADRAEQLTLSSVLSRDLHTMHSTISVFSSGSNRTRYLRSLPRAYVKFYSELAKRKCHSCNQFPARPAVCLLCGMLLCAANTCPSIHSDKGGYPDEANPGACTVHAKKCGRGSGVFLLVLEGAVLLVYWKLAAYVGSLYVDEYGEEFGERNRELSKGRPLYLNEERRERLLRLWLRHEIPNEVVKIQNSSERVIRNSHY